MDSQFAERLARRGMASFLVGLAMVCAVGCGQQPDARHDADAMQAAPAAGVAAGAMSGAPLAIRAFAYQLQDCDVAALAVADVDLLIIDQSRDGSDAGRWTRAELDAIRRGNPNRPKKILAYLSIGEAEDYRGYWRRAWDADRDGRPDAAAPAWLGPANPEWPGNYKVRYWLPEWQELIIGIAAAAVHAGFDGLYLDIIDAYEYWGPDGTGELAAEQAERRMVEWVRTIAARTRREQARSAAGPAATPFLIVPQNGEALGRYPDYLAAVSAIGREDIFFDGDDPNPPDEVAATLADLRRFREAGKPVLAIEYPASPTRRREALTRARAEEFVPLIAPRALDRLTVKPD